MAVKINKLELEYVVPFNYHLPDNMSLADITDIYQKKYKFEIFNPATTEYAANDFLENINGIFETNSDYSIAVALRVAKEKKHAINLMDNEGHNIKIENHTIYLFENGIGFFRYKVTPDNKLLECSDELLKFCNVFKEVSYSHSSFKLTQLTNEKIEIDCALNEKFIAKKELIYSYLTENSFSVSNDGKLIEKGSQRIVLDNDDEIKKLTKSDSEKTSFLFIERKKEFHTGKWIHEILSDIPELSFMPERKGNTPDIALQMSYSFITSDSQDETLDYLFRISHGYSAAYNRYKNDTEDVFIPFSNKFYQATGRGMAECAVEIPNNDSNRFSGGEAAQRAVNYFYIYILVLHQYYSLIYKLNQYSSNITSINNDKMTYSMDLLKQQVYEINHFSIKNMFSGVSYLPNCNAFYLYVQRIMNIEKLYSCTSQRMIGMTKLIEEADEERRGNLLYIFTIIGAVFAVTEVISNTSGIVSSFVENGNEGNVWTYTGIILVILLLISCIMWASGSLLKALLQKRSTKRKRKKK